MLKSVMRVGLDIEALVKYIDVSARNMLEEVTLKALKGDIITADVY